MGTGSPDNVSNKNEKKRRENQPGKYYHEKNETTHKPFSRIISAESPDEISHKIVTEVKHYMFLVLFRRYGKKKTNCNH